MDRPVEVEGLLAPAGNVGEIRQLTLFFADLVNSTALSTQVEPETYRLVVGRYRKQVLCIVSGYDGHIGSTKGDGLLAVFGHPTSHGDDARRAVQAGLEITREVSRLSDQSQRRFGFGVDVRVGVHCGLVYLDAAHGDFSGKAANVASGISGLAPPGAVVVSGAVASLITNDFELEACPPAAVKGVEEPIDSYLVVSERWQPDTSVGHARRSSHSSCDLDDARTDR
jgi:class 3 adenylate cyclase